MIEKIYKFSNELYEKVIKKEKTSTVRKIKKIDDLPEPGEIIFLTDENQRRNVSAIVMFVSVLKWNNQFNCPLPVVGINNFVKKEGFENLMEYVDFKKPDGKTYWNKKYKYILIGFLKQDQDINVDFVELFTETFDIGGK